MLQLLRGATATAKAATTEGRLEPAGCAGLRTAKREEYECCLWPEFALQEGLARGQLSNPDVQQSPEGQRCRGRKPLSGQASSQLMANMHSTWQTSTKRHQKVLGQLSSPAVSIPEGLLDWGRKPTVG